MASAYGGAAPLKASACTIYGYIAEAATMRRAAEKVFPGVAMLVDADIRGHWSK
jgi:hypothetical protein